MSRIFPAQPKVSTLSKPQTSKTLAKSKDEHAANRFYWYVIIIPACHVHWRGATNSDAFSHLTIEHHDNEITNYKD